MITHHGLQICGQCRKNGGSICTERVAPLDGYNHFDRSNSKFRIVKNNVKHLVE